MKKNTPEFSVKNAILPRPQTMGVFVFLLALLALLAGYLRNELVLSLLGTIFLGILLYCFAALLVMGVLQGKKAPKIRIEITARQIRAGEQSEVYLGEAERFFAFPGMFIRYRLKLATIDRRLLSCVFDPRRKGNTAFPVPGRGAYFGPFDELLFLDAPGFFRLTFKVPREHGSRLLAVPGAAEERIPLRIHPGGTEKRGEVHYRKTDNLTENRPYVPGDDPRRINWKLYGHGAESELYVREGEKSPPPHSRLLLLLDTQIDSELYTLEEGRRDVDMLCENAMRTIQELEQKGIEVFTGYTGGTILSGIEASLAWPAALPLMSREELPRPSELRAGEKTPENLSKGVREDMGILVFALPRMSGGKTALDRFLADRPPGQHTDLIFLFSGERSRKKEREEAARTCAAFYRRKNNVYVDSYYSDILNVFRNKTKEL